MESQVPFGEKEQTDIELVRQVVWRRLRQEAWTELSVVDLGFDKFVSFQDHYYRFPFGNLVREVVWELIGLGILVPGRPSSQSAQASGCDASNLPQFRVSLYGRQVLDAGRVVPQDPARISNRSKG